jgi:signal transduction histidine kinase
MLPMQRVAANRELFGGAETAEHYEIGDRTLAIRRAPVVDEDGQLLGEVVVMHDLSDEAAVSQAKTDFIATISHELRTPLTPIFGNLDLLLRGYTGILNDEQNEMLRQVRKRAGDINDIVKNMIMIASIEANTLTVDLQQQDMATAVEAAMAPLRVGFNLKGLAVTIDIPEELPYVLADRELLKVILTQLLDNARRYTQQGEVKISARTEGAMVRVDVADTGIGISKESRDRLFARFQRIEGNNSPERGGGLGLAITRQIIERQGGRVWVESTPGQGSVFSFVLPQAHEQAFAVAQTEEYTAK